MAVYNIKVRAAYSDINPDFYSMVVLLMSQQYRGFGFKRGSRMRRFRNAVRGNSPLCKDRPRSTISFDERDCDQTAV